MKTNSNSYKSIATRLLQSVFYLYILITFILTLLQMVLEYQSQKLSIRNDLENIQRAYERELAIDIWQLNQESLESSIQGMMEIPIVVGVIIRDNQNRLIAHSGIIEWDQNVGDAGQHIEVLGLQDEEEIPHKTEPYLLEVFKHQFPVEYPQDEETHLLGEVSIFSNTSVIIRRIRFGFILVIVTTVLKMTLLWFIFLWLFNSLLKAPLEALSMETQKITLANLHNIRIKIPMNVEGENEITELQDSFNKMITNLNDSIRDRESAQKAVIQLQNYLSNIINSMPSMIIGVDSLGRITQWNMAAENFLKIKADQAVGELLADIYPDISQDMDRILKSIESKNIIKEQYRLRNREDRTLYENFTVYPLITNGASGAVIRIDDVTKEYELEEKLKQSQKLDAIGQLAGGVAHDFNNMLTGIMSSVQLLKSAMEEENRDEMDEYIDLIDQSAIRAADLTSKLLAFGRKSSLSFSTVDIQNIIDDSISLLLRTINKKVNIKRQYNAQYHSAIGNHSALQNVILNLGINASQAMPNGGDLSISTYNTELDDFYCSVSPFNIHSGNYIVIELKDNGYGISKKNLERIFEPFFTTKTQGKGTGLGLAASYGTILDHNGAINVYSEEGTGTVFHIYLPCENLLERETPRPTADYTGSGTILLVDDENMIRITGEHILHQIGFDVILAENGMEALSKYKDHRESIKLVILDYMMPVMNGYETMIKIKEMDDKCPVLLTSGFINNDVLDELKSKGLDGFIHKPFSAKQLREQLKKTLG